MTFDTFAAVYYTAGFLVPGFIWSAVLAMLVPRRVAAEQTHFLSFFTLSCINNGLWSWALFIIFATGFIGAHPIWSGFFLWCIIFLSPICLGLLTGFLQQRRHVPGFLGRFGFRTIDPIPAAWDWHFSQGKPCWVLVTLKDGSHIYGLFSSRSFVGDDANFRDLFLEAAYRLLDSGEWAPVEDTAGVWIAPDQISAIEFRDVGEIDYGK